MVACRRRSSLVRRGGQTGVPATASAAESTPGDSWGPKTGPSCRRRSSLVSSCRRRSSLVCRDGQTDVPAHAIGGGSRHSACSGSFNSARLRLASLRMTRGRALAQHCPGRHVAVRQSSTARDGTWPCAKAAPPGTARGRAVAQHRPGWHVVTTRLPVAERSERSEPAAESKEHVPRVRPAQPTPTPATKDAASRAQQKRAAPNLASGRVPQRAKRARTARAQRQGRGRPPSDKVTASPREASEDCSSPEAR